MKTLTVVWVDDSTEWVESEQFKIEDAVEEAGYVLDIRHRTDGDGVADIAFLATVDVVLMDYHLEPFFGNEVIADIRYHSNNDRIPVVFYSQDPDVDLIKLVERFSRVKCVNRNEVGAELLKHCR
jgi:DNA-binding response OmpR family regulator